MAVAAIALTGCPDGKDLPKRLDNGFDVTEGARLLGAVFANEDGWTAVSEVTGEPIEVWDEFADRARSFTFEDIASAKDACRATDSTIRCYAVSYPEGTKSEALIVSLTYGVWEPFGIRCEAAECGGSAERSFTVEYLSGDAASPLPNRPKLGGSAPGKGTDASALEVPGEATIGSGFFVEQPAPLSVQFPDGTVVLGTPISMYCATDDASTPGVRFVAEVPKANQWIAKTLDMPTVPAERNVDGDTIVTGQSEVDDRWIMSATGTRTADGQFVLLAIC